MKGLFQIDSLYKNLPSEFDLVICSASFEDRCEKLISALNEQVVCNRFLISFNSNEYEEINERATGLLARLTVWN